MPVRAARPLSRTRPARPDLRSRAPARHRGSRAPRAARRLGRSPRRPRRQPASPARRQHGRHHLGRHVHRRVAGDDQVHVADPADRRGEDRGQLDLPASLRVSSSMITTRSRPRERAPWWRWACRPLPPGRQADQSPQSLGEPTGQFHGDGIIGADARLRPAPSIVPSASTVASSGSRVHLYVTTILITNPPDESRRDRRWPVILTQGASL